MKINSLETLRKEKIRLRLQLRELEDKLHDDLQWAIEELKPANIIGRAVANIFQNRNKNLMSQGVGSVVGLLMKNIFLRNSSWVFKLILPLIVKNISSNYIGDHKEGILAMAKNLIRKMRTANHKHNGHYDQSTAQSHY